MRRQSVNSLSKVITSILLILLFVGAFGLLFYATKGFSQKVQTFYVTYNGTIYSGKNNNISLIENGKMVFFVKEFLSNSTESYSVKVAPKVDKNSDFEFLVGDTEYPYVFSGERDITIAFNVVKDKSSFTLELPKNFDMYVLLGAVYSEDITISTMPLALENVCLQVVSSDEKTVISFTFYVGVLAQDVVLDYGGITL